MELLKDMEISILGGVEKVMIGGSLVATRCPCIKRLCLPVLQINFPAPRIGNHELKKCK